MKKKFFFNFCFKPIFLHRGKVFGYCKTSIHFFFKIIITYNIELKFLDKKVKIKFEFYNLFNSR